MRGENGTGRLVKGFVLRTKYKYMYIASLNIYKSKSKKEKMHYSWGHASLSI